MKKIIVFTFLVCAFARADSTVYLTRDTLAAASTYYIFVDRSLTIATTDFFAHSKTGANHDTFVKQLEINISSNTLEAKIGFIYDINSTSATIKWFDRVSRNSVSETGAGFVKVYSDRGLRLSYENREFMLPNTFDTAVKTTSVFQIYNSSIATSPAKGDILLKVTASDVYGKIDAKMIYDVR